MTAAVSNSHPSLVKGLKCRECGNTYDKAPIHVCEFCFGPLEVDYDYAAIGKVLTRAKIESRPHTMWRYAELLPIDGPPSVGQATGMTPLGHILVGVGVKAGAKVPDISTPEKFRAALLAAKGVAYADPKAGTSAGKIIDQFLSAPEFAKIKRVPVQGLAVTALANGQADIALQMLPELAANRDVALAGPVPEIYGARVDFSAAIAVQTIDAVAAQAFISFLTNPQNAPAWKNNGLVLLGY